MSTQSSMGGTELDHAILGEGYDENQENTTVIQLQSILHRAEQLADSVDRKFKGIKVAEGASAQDNAKHIALVLRELRTYIFAEDCVLFHLFRIGFVDKLIAGLMRCSEYRVLFNETLRCIIGFLRNINICSQIQERLLHYEVTKTLFFALRRYPDDENIKVQCVEVIDSILSRSREMCSESESRNLCVFMVSNGCIEAFPRLIQDFAERSRTVCLLRITESLIFFVRNAPDSAIARLVAGGMGRLLITLALAGNSAVKVKVVTALIGLLVSSAEIAAMVNKELGWEDICYLSVHDDGNIFKVYNNPMRYSTHTILDSLCFLQMFLTSGQTVYWSACKNSACVSRVCRASRTCMQICMHREMIILTILLQMRLCQILKIPWSALKTLT